MKKLFHIVVALLLLHSFVQAGQSTLKNYISEGLANNLALKQKQLSFEKSLGALAEARGMYLPALSIDARYSRAGGGRDIEFPIGSLLNPVYSTLNQLLTAVGEQARSFPVLDDQVIPFLRKEEHDTKIRLVQPLIQPAIYYNSRVKKELSNYAGADVNTYKNQLVADIKTAYYGFLQTHQLVILYQNTHSLVNENLRISESLYKNQMATKDVVFRAESEKFKLEQQLADAAKKNSLARSYFNFLINRELDEKISIDSLITDDPATGLSLEAAENKAIQKRHELKQLNFAINAADNAVSLNRAAFLPNVNLVLDYGFQGEEYSFTQKDDYWMASALLSWNLFNGFQDDAKKEQAQIDKKSLQNRRTELESQIRLQVKDAFLALKVARKKIESANAQSRAASESFKIINKKYEEGMASQIEFIDGRVNMTNAQINKILTQYDYLTRIAQFEKITGDFSNE